MGKASLDEIQTRYRSETVARRYDKRYNDLEGSINYRMMLRALRKALVHVPSGGNVLDMPCGTGIYTWFLTKLGYQTFASDISLEMIAVARTRQRETVDAMPQFFQGDIFGLPFRNQAFDALLCMRFMNLVDRPVRVRAVREMARVADVLIISYYHKYTFKHFSRSVRHQIGLRGPLNSRLSKRAFLDEIAETGLELQALISVVPILSEAWVAVLRPPAESASNRASGNKPSETQSDRHE